jgi:phospholipid-binding lipoprotein MlaA
VRDGVGLAGDFAVVPWGLVAPPAVTWPMFGVRVVSARESVLDQLDDLERSSLDFYASLRSIYLQRREQEIFNGNVPADRLDEDIFEFEDEPAD